ncbi:uncharacterized protein ARMOST_11650 [Armillaria ostoyae]|uniref:Heterokaryon incompatibility domain-containing protein n=1 Tax=Armillaria ostoyae TaxID=47428 RepID=A0A284RHT6_ARMOS|nr:uncharacterized protein ARMOST_11650 [Armillaria ostoyae]
MSFLSSTSSDWSDNNVESSDLANVPRVLQLRTLYLLTYGSWFARPAGAVFSVESFQKAWAVKEPYPRFAFSYTTPKWRHILRQQRRHLIEFGRQCEWCKLVSKVIKRNCRRRRPKKNNKYSLIVQFDEDYRGPDDCSFFLAMENGSGRAYVTHTAEGMPDNNYQDDPAARYIRGRDGLVDVDSAMSYDLIKKRVVECSLHEHCPPPQCARLPTRVINCSNPDQPRLFLSNGMKGYYVALSYVWGESQPDRTTTKNLDSYIDSIPLKNIPTAVMDAITVTQKLGFHYLWVDSFCIVQDSKDDKAQEIAQMRNIYHNSYVTIIAACAHKVSDGFLHDRRPTVRKLNPSEALVPFHCPDGGIGTMRISRSISTLSEPVDDRAWCFEKRVLSPRKLIYATHTLLYECQTIRNHVNGAPSVVPLYDAGKIPHLPHPIFLPASVMSDTDPSVTEMEDAWYDIVRLYTARTLTKPRPAHCNIRHR